MIFLSMLSLIFFPRQSSGILYRTCAQDFYPKFYIHNNEMRGYAVDIINAVRRIDKNINFEGYKEFCTIPRIEVDLLEGRKDVFLAAFKTSAREKKFYFLDTPLYLLRYVVVVRKNDPVKVSSFDEIRRLGKEGVILTLFGTGLQSFLEKQSGLQIDSSVSTVDANLRKLQNGRGRFFFTVDLGIEDLLKRPPWKDKFAILPAEFGKEPQFIMISKKMPSKNIAPLLKAISLLKSSGELDRIFDAYKSEQ